MLHETVEMRLSRAIGEFCANEMFPRTVNEVTLTIALAHYVREEFRQWNVDAEYNRNRDDVKKLEGKIVKPDIIVHRRQRLDNLPVIEAEKTTNRRGVVEDKRHLRDFHADQEYRYQHSAFLTFRFDEDQRHQCAVEWFCCRDGISRTSSRPAEAHARRSPASPDRRGKLPVNSNGQCQSHARESRRIAG